MVPHVVKYKNTFRLLIWQLILIPWLVRTSNCAKILGLFPHASESHFSVMRTFVMELARRGHNITIYTGHRLDEIIHNFRQFTIEPEFSFLEEVRKEVYVKDDMQALADVNDIAIEGALAKAGHTLVFNFLSNSHVQRLLQLSPEEFDYDLVIVDLFYTEALIALGYHFNKTTVALVSSDFANYMEHVQENIVPSACLPYDGKQLRMNLSYWERLNNIWTCFNRKQRFQAIHYSQQEHLIKQFFGSSPASNSTILQLQNYLTLLLINNYMPLMEPKPLLPNMLLVGGLQVGGAQELPWHMKRFLDDARNGVIYMNLGDHYVCSAVPQKTLDLLLNVFAKIKISVIWTCHDADNHQKNLPKNIYVQHGVGQMDILAHPHIKLFITNGDLISVQDSIMRMVPLLILPIFTNEYQNSYMIEKLGIGLHLSYRNLTQFALESILKELIHNEIYVLNIRNISRMFRDRPLGGLSNTIFWLDYILKYGSNSLRVSTIGIPLSQLHLFDLTLYYLILVVILIIFLFLIPFFILIIWKKHKQQEQQKLFSKLN